MLVPGNNTFGDDVDGKSESRSHEVATWFCNDLHRVLWEVLVQSNAQHLCYL